MALKSSGGPYVGLDIGSNFIKVCEIDVRGGRANLRGISVLPTPTDVVLNSEITDPVGLGKMIRDVLKQAGIRSKKVITSVAGQSALVVRIIEVPKMTRAELQETMKWEMERHVPFAAEQVVMDFQPLTPPEDVPEGQNMEVLLAVAQEGLVTRHVQAIQAAGLTPLAIDIEPLAASRSLLDLSNGAGPSGTVALIDIGASTTDISIYRDGRLSFTRSIQLAGNSLTKSISDVLGQPLADAERLKKELASIAMQDPGAGGPGGVDDLFGDPMGGTLPSLPFGEPEAPGGVMLGGTFGMAADPGASTATEAPEASPFDIAGSGFGTDAFTTPAAGTEAGATAPGGEAPLFGAEPSPFGAPAPAPAAPAFGVDAPAFGAPEAPAPFDLTGAGASPGLAGPTPMGDPFALDVDGPPAAAPPAASPFPAGLGGPTPAGNPFDPDAGAATAPGSATNPGGDSLFGAAPAADPFALPVDTSSPFGAPPSADPFAAAAAADNPFAPSGADPFGTLGGLDDLGALGGPMPSSAGVPPSAMTDEDYLRTQIGDAVMPILHELVTELRRSLDFYRNRANGLGAEKVIISGGTAKLPGLVDFLALNLELPVELGNPLQYLTQSKADPAYLQDIGPYFPVCVGLAIRELLAVAAAPKRPKQPKPPKPPKPAKKA